MTTAVNAEYLLHVNVHYRESCSPRRAEDLLRPRAYRLHQQVAGMLSHPHPGRMGDDSGEPAVGAFDDASPVGHGGGAAVAAATVAPPRAEPLPGYHAAQCVQSSPPALHARHNWSASHFPDCGPHRVLSRKGFDQWQGNIRNSRLNFVSRRRSWSLRRSDRSPRSPANTASATPPWETG